jgi:hypothetical protein
VRPADPKVEAEKQTITQRDEDRQAERAERDGDRDRAVSYEIRHGEAG